ncbi:MAG: GNAT family N-acetyltransferase [Planctomycetaceae bacterium]
MMNTHREVTDIRVLHPLELTDAQLAVWSQLQEQHGIFESPYFRPEFTRTVAAVHDGVEVAVLTSGDEIAGFFPFQRQRGDVAAPVGGRMSDFHGAIVDPAVRWDAVELMRGCGLRAWNFHHLIADQAPLQPFRYRTSESLFADVSDGFDAYYRERRKTGSKRLKRIRQKTRKLERDAGAIRLESHVADRDVLETLMRWKSKQYRESGLFDLFSVPAPRRLLETVLTTQGRGFAGMLSVLYVDGRVGAIDFGIRSRGVLHSWFPAYDRALSAYGLGHILLVEMLKAAPELGIRRIHVGKAKESYKHSFASGCVDVSDGAVDVRPLRSRAKRGWFETKQWLKETPVQTALRRPVRWARRMFDRSAMS